MHRERVQAVNRGCKQQTGKNSARRERLGRRSKESGLRGTNRFGSKPESVHKRTEPVF